MRYNDNYYQGVEYALVNKGSSTTSDWINNLQQPFGLSTDMWESIEYAKDFVENHWDDEVTFVGHSNGEILNMIFGGISAPIDRVEVLQRYSWNPIVNHSMEAVKQGLWVGGYN